MAQQKEGIEIINHAFRLIFKLISKNITIKTIKKIDYGESFNKSTAWPEKPSWFKKGSDLKNLYEGMVVNGIKEKEAVKIIGENWLAFMKLHFQIYLFGRLHILS